MADEVTSRIARQRPDQTLAPDARERLAALLLGAADPMGATSTAVSHFSPETAQWMQDTQAKYPGMANVGGLALGGAALARAPRVIGGILGVGTGSTLNAPEAEAQKAKASPKTVATPEALTAESERRQSPDYNPLAEVQTKIKELETRIAGNTTKVSEINKGFMPRQPDRVAAIKESRAAASAPLNKQISDDQTELNALRGIEKQLQETDRPAREKYPYAGPAIVIGGTLASAALSRYGMGKIAHGIDDVVEKATKAANPLNSVEFIRQAQIAGDRAGSAPVKKIATALMAASLPADIQAAIDASDYKGAPKWTRAYKEAEKQFSDPMAYIQSLGPAVLSGIAGTALGYKMAPGGQADAARRLGETARHYDPRGLVERMFYGSSAPEAIAPELAKAVAKASKSDARAAAVQSANRTSQAPQPDSLRVIQGEILDAGQPPTRQLPAPAGAPKKGGQAWPMGGSKAEQKAIEDEIIRQLLQR